MNFSYNAEMVNYFVSNMDYLSNLIKPVKEQREKLLMDLEPIFHKDIEKQYLDRIKWVVITDACKRTGLSSEEVAMFVEHSINLRSL